MRQALRIAVISDIHAASSAQPHSNGTYVVVPAKAGRRNPLDDLKKWIRATADLPKVDYLVCPGDITNQADSDAFEWMWKELREIAALLGAREVHATCGNHDLDSRYLEQRSVEDPDAKGALLALSARFPALSSDEHNHFWARNYVVLDRAKPFHHRVLLLNTCAYHGSAKQDEIKHGRVSGRTISDIASKLAKAERVGLNIVVCHHHLHPLPGWDSASDSDYQYVRKGGELIRRLEEANVGPWLVIHGHRHWPDCIYAAGGSGSPVLFCAGSFGKQEAEVTNQFHVLQVEANAAAPKPRGTVNTWSWSLSKGWQPSEQSVKALTFQSGFGFQGPLTDLVEQISHNLPDGTPYLEWAEMVEKVPDLRHLLSGEFARLESDLKPRNIGIFTKNGEPVQVARRPAK